MSKFKDSRFAQNYKRMWPYVRPYKWRALAAMLITVPVGLMDAAIAWSLKPYMDVVLIEKPSGFVLYLPIIIIGFGVLQGVLNYASTYLNAWVGQKVSMDLKMTLFGKLMGNDAKFFDQETSGQVQYRFNGDADAACGGLISNVRVFITRVVSSLALIAVLIYNSWILALLAVGMLVFGLLPLTTIRRRIEGLMKKAVVYGAEVSTHYNETFSGNRIVTAYNLAGMQKKKFAETQQTVFKIGMKMIKRTGIISPVMHVIVSMGIALVIWTGSYLIVTGHMTPGSFVSFIAALVMLYTPIKGLGGTYTAVQMSFLAMERVWEVMDRVPDVQNKPDAVRLEKIKSEIAYNNVGFRYTDEKAVLKGVSFTVNVGQTIALVGNSGGGKSTIASLLPRFYDVTEGSITIDGVDIRDFELNSLREKMAVVFQDNFLFSGTIRDNIVLDREDVSEDDVRTAVKNACLDDFIGSLENGLDTEIGERGVLLSGGQRQRIAIARAFLRNAPIVILDEATSALDNKSEAVVQEAISNLMVDRTVFVIAHRLSTIRNADKIIVVNDGEIAEHGTHGQLIGQGGAYASLYNMQKP